MKKSALVFISMIKVGFLFAQSINQNAFDFLNIPIGAKMSALGGEVVSSVDHDASMFLANPALLEDTIDNNLSWSYFNYYADVKYNVAAYAKRFNQIGLIGIGVQSLSYGEFTGRDATGELTSNFSGNDLALVLSHSRTLSSFRLGINLKFIHSNLESMSSSAIGFDVGGSFIHPSKTLVISMLFKNFGFVIADPSVNQNLRLPSDVQLGLTFKPSHMPFRFTFTAHDLLNLGQELYLDQESDHLLSRTFSHVNIGTELLLSDHVNLRMGYNHLLKKAMKLEDQSGMSGLSLGMMFRIKAFEFGYTYSSYHLNEGRSHITISSNLNKVFNQSIL